MVLLVQLTYLYVDKSNNSLFVEEQQILLLFSMKFLFFCERLLLELFFFLSFETGNICLLSEWLSMLTCPTLLSIFIFCNVTYFEENVNVILSIGSTNSKRHI